MALFFFHKIQSFAPHYSSVLTGENSQGAQWENRLCNADFFIILNIKTVMTKYADHIQHADYCLELACSLKWHIYKVYKHFRFLVKVPKRHLLPLQTSITQNQNKRY